jgi:hypothetical protein
MNVSGDLILGQTCNVHEYHQMVVVLPFPLSPSRENWVADSETAARRITVAICVLDGSSSCGKLKSLELSQTRGRTVSNKDTIELNIPCAGTKTEVRDGKLAVLKVNEGVY